MKNDINIFRYLIKISIVNLVFSILTIIINIFFIARFAFLKNENELTKIYGNLDLFLIIKITELYFFINKFIIYIIMFIKNRKLNKNNIVKIKIMFSFSLFSICSILFVILKTNSYVVLLIIPIEIIFIIFLIKYALKKIFFLDKDIRLIKELKL